MRNTHYKIDRIFTDRWSPRAMSGEKLARSELMSLFEAARWAPSSSNGQPWRFIYAERDTEHWERLFDLLNQGNQVWVKNAAALVVVISKNYFEDDGKPDRTSSFTTGAAFENLSLQGSMNNLVIHGMAGFDYNQAKEELQVPDGYTVEAMVAIGKPGKVEDLPERLQKREHPSDRKPVEDLVMEGIFRGGRNG